MPDQTPIETDIFRLILSFKKPNKPKYLVFAELYPDQIRLRSPQANLNSSADADFTKESFCGEIRISDIFGVHRMKGQSADDLSAYLTIYSYILHSAGVRHRKVWTFEISPNFMTKNNSTAPIGGRIDVVAIANRWMTAIQKLIQAPISRKF